MKQSFLSSRESSKLGIEGTRPHGPLKAEARNHLSLRMALTEVDGKVKFGGGN